MEPFIETDVADADGRTLLSYACEEGHAEVVKLLLARNDLIVNTRDIDGQTPLSYAAHQGHDAVVHLLLKRPDIDARAFYDRRIVPPRDLVSHLERMMIPSQYFEVLREINGGS